MRMNPTRGEPASQLIARLGEEKLARLLEENADEPDATIVARALKARAIDTTDDLCRAVECLRSGTRTPYGRHADLQSRRFAGAGRGALRIAVNDEFSALDTFPAGTLPSCSRPGRPRRRADLSLRRRSPGQESLSVRAPRRRLRRDRGRGRAPVTGRSAREPARRIRKAQMG